MPRQPDFIKDATIKNYLKEKIKIRSSKEAIAQIDSTFNALVITVIKQAAKFTQENKRKTILPEDITPARWPSPKSSLCLGLRQHGDLTKISQCKRLKNV